MDYDDSSSVETLRETLTRILDGSINYPIRVAVIGKSGAGKSSLCNAIFGSEVARTSPVDVGTLAPQEIDLTPIGKNMTIVDMPGIGESDESDEAYHVMYREQIPRADIVLWVVMAGDRALRDATTCVNNVVKPLLKNRPFVVVLTKIDKIGEVDDWNNNANEPGNKTAELIDHSINFLAEKFSLPTSEVISVSSTKRYHISNLVDQIVFRLDGMKKLSFTRSVAEGNVSKAASQNAQQGWGEWCLEKAKVILAPLGTSLGKKVATEVLTAIAGVVPGGSMIFRAATFGMKLLSIF